MYMNINFVKGQYFVLTCLYFSITEKENGNCIPESEVLKLYS